MPLFTKRYELVQTTRYFPANGVNPAPAPVVMRRYSGTFGSIKPSEYYRAAKTIAQDRMKIDTVITYGEQFNETRITFSFTKEGDLARRMSQIFSKRF